MTQINGAKCKGPEGPDQRCAACNARRPLERAEWVHDGWFFRAGWEAVDGRTYCPACLAARGVRVTA